MTVHKKLMAARVALQGIELKKSGQNKFAGYNYFELGDFLPHIQEIFNRIGLCGVVSYNIEYAQLCITDVDDGTVIVITSPMAEANLKGTHPIQNLGAVETYQRRYLWMTAMEIVEHDILDASEPVKEQPKKLEVKPASEPEIWPEKPKAKQKPLPIPPPFKNDMVQWEIKVIESTEETWIDLIMDAAKVCLEITKSAEDVQNIYRVNRTLFDKLKAEYPDQHDELLDLFKKEKQSFTKE
jgi:hypothetical protein